MLAINYENKSNYRIVAHEVDSTWLSHLKLHDQSVNQPIKMNGAKQKLPQ